MSKLVNRIAAIAALALAATPIIGLTAAHAAEPATPIARIRVGDLTLSNPADARLTRDGELVALSGGEGGAARACFSCHGLDGAGDGVSAPRLAGLDSGYLQKQLDDYASDRRHDTVMSPIARPLSGPARQAVAAYYARLPAPGTPTMPGPASDSRRRMSMPSGRYCRFMPRASGTTPVSWNV